jgi:Zn-dependent protease
MNPNPPPEASAPAAATPLGQRGLRLARVGGVPVYLNPSWLLLAVILVLWYGPVAQLSMPGLGPGGGYALAVAFAGCLLLSVLLHEVGHALVARHYRIAVRSITLELLGGYTQMEGDSPHPRADLFVSMVGPLVSGVIGLGALALERALPGGTVLDALAFQLAWSNIVVAIFNALPGMPLDGGRALRAIVWGITGSRDTGTVAAGWIGRIVALATLGVSIALVQAGRVGPLNMLFAGLIALTMWQGASAAIAYGRLAKRLPGVNLRLLARPVFRVESGMPLAEAIRRAQEVGIPPAGLVVIDATGRATSLVNPHAAEAVPPERRPWVPVESVARTLEPGRTLDADLAGTDLIRAVQANPAPTYLVTAGNDVVGVLQTADLARMLNR